MRNTDADHSVSGKTNQSQPKKQNELRTTSELANHVRQEAALATKLQTRVLGLLLLTPTQTLVKT